MKLAQASMSLLLTLSLNAYATDYVPAGQYGGWKHGGYSDVIVNSNTAVIKFSGNDYNSPQQARMYVLYRAAQVTIEQGYQYFVVVSSSDSKENINLRTKKVTKTLYPSVRSDSTDYTDTEIESYSVSQSNVSNCANSAKCSSSNSAVIKMFNGDVPAGFPQAYVAEDVIAHYGYAIDDANDDVH